MQDSLRLRDLVHLIFRNKEPAAPTWPGFAECENSKDRFEMVCVAKGSSAARVEHLSQESKACAHGQHSLPAPGLKEGVRTLWMCRWIVEASCKPRLPTLIKSAFVLASCFDLCCHIASDPAGAGKGLCIRMLDPSACVLSVPLAESKLAE